MNLALETPLVLALLPLALLPLIFAVQKSQGYPSLAAVVTDPLSRAIDIGLHVLGMLSIAALILAIGGLHLKGQTIERVGEGAHIVLLLDRSSSMDDTFAGRPPGEGEASKSAAARRLLRDFIARRPHDRFGVAAFSTLPMPVLPITSHTDAVLAAVDAIDRPGLAFTNVGLGLSLALAMHEADPTAASRAILLVSDGAAVIDRRVQERLRAQIAKRPVNLYWLYLRTAGAPGIFDVPGPDVPDTPQALPERHLNLFFHTLKVPVSRLRGGKPEGGRRRHHRDRQARAQPDPLPGAHTRVRSFGPGLWDRRRRAVPAAARQARRGPSRCRLADKQQRGRFRPARRTSGEQTSAEGRLTCACPASIRTPSAAPRRRCCGLR